MPGMGICLAYWAHVCMGIWEKVRSRHMPGILGTCVQRAYGKKCAAGICQAYWAHVCNGHMGKRAQQAYARHIWYAGTKT